MKLTISLQVTLDGVAQANGGNNEELDPGFTRGGWATGVGDPEVAEYILETWRRPDAFLLGRKTFSLFETYWGARSDDGRFGQAISSKPKYVVSSALTDPAWDQTSILSGDVKSQILNLKDSANGNDAELLLVGSTSLARWLLEEEIADQLNLIQFPVIVGQGHRFLPDAGKDFALKLQESEVFPSGVVALTYAVDGRPNYT